MDENGEWRRLHNEERHSLYRSSNIVRVIARMVFKILTGKPIGTRRLGRSRRRWEDDIRMDVKEIVICTSNWDDLAEGRNYWRIVVNAPLNPRIA